MFNCTVPDVYGHELGHNLGMGHASTPSSEYGDNTDIMGLGQNRLRQVNASHKEQMGWLPPEQIVTVTASGVYQIAPIELYPSTALAPQALKIFKGDTNEYYYLSYRRGIGFDANICCTYLDRLSVHRYPGDGSVSNTYLLALLDDGTHFVDTVNGITVTQTSHNNDYVTVQVQLNPTCTAAAPTVSLSPTSQSAAAGGTLSYTVSLVNRDSAICPQSVFNLAHAVPSGWTGAVSPTTLTVLPGNTGQATLAVTSPLSAAVGSYNARVNVTNTSTTSSTASGTATYTVLTSTDSVPPTAPTGLVASVKRQQVGLSWQASTDNVDVSGYRVFRNGVLLSTTTGLSLTDTSVSGGLTYSYSVVAYNAAGSVSAASNTVSVTIPKSRR